MKLYACLAALTMIAGCANDAVNEDTAKSESELIAWLASPPGFEDHHLVGTWVPVNPSGFEGGSAASKTVVFAKNGADRTYRLQGDATPCEGDCRQNGVWFVGNNLLASGVVGTRVNTRSTVVQGNEKSLFVQRLASGEIRLLDLDTCSFLIFECKNQWTKTPILSVDDL